MIEIESIEVQTQEREGRVTKRRKKKGPKHSEIVQKTGEYGLGSQASRPPTHIRRELANLGKLSGVKKKKRATGSGDQGEGKTLGPKLSLPQKEKGQKRRAPALYGARGARMEIWQLHKAHELTRAPGNRKVPG